MTPINTNTEAVERLALDHQAVGNNPDTLTMSHPHHWKTAAVLQQLVKERDEARARVKVLADALRGMMDREARIALQANVHKPLWEASPEWIAAWNTRAAFAASQPADHSADAGKMVAPVTPAEAAKVLLSNRAALAAMVDAAEEAHATGVSFDVVIGRALRAVGRDEANG